MVINHGDLADGPRVLQLESRLLLDAEDDARRRLDADSGRALGNGFESIVDLLKDRGMTVSQEPSKSTQERVGRHGPGTAEERAQG